MLDLVEYKGFYVEVVDTNYDSPTEYICVIYKNKEAYENGESLEDISLEGVSADLTTEIKDYLDYKYIEKDDTLDIDNFIDETDNEILLELCLKILDNFELMAFNECNLDLRNKIEACKNALEIAKNEQI